MTSDADPARIETRKLAAARAAAERDDRKGVRAVTYSDDRQGPRLLAHQNTKISRSGKVINPMNADDYQRMVRALTAQGYEVFAAVNGDDLRYMLAVGAEAAYSQGRITHIGEIPSRGAFFEEVIHLSQARIYGETSDPIELCAREVEANRKLLKFSGVYKIDDYDVSDIRKNLGYWENRFKRETGVSYDDSHYR